jgi:hypothetical protein
MTHDIEQMEKFFAELDALPEDEIKARLAIGIWGDEKRKLVQLYLEEKASKRQKAAQAETLEIARGANRRATIALIVAAISALVAILTFLFKG